MTSTASSSLSVTAAPVGSAMRSPHPDPRATGYRPQQDKTRLDKMMQALAGTRLGGWLFVNVFPTVDRRLMALSRGRVKVAMGQPILLLHTRGARSNQARTTPLLYTSYGDAVIVVASKAGAEHHPAWYHNIRRHPDDVAIEVAGVRRRVRARVVDGPERARLWERATDNYNGYDRYQMRAAGRTIPVIVLEPREEPPVSAE